MVFVITIEVNRLVSVRVNKLILSLSHDIVYYFLVCMVLAIMQLSAHKIQGSFLLQVHALYAVRAGGKLLLP